MSGRVEILWKETDAEGCTDVLPIQDLFGQDDRPSLVHLVRGLDGTTCRARYDINRTLGQVDLDYRPYVKFNTVENIALGVMRLLTVDGQVRAVQWKDEGDDNFEEVDVEIVSYNEVPSSESAYERSAEDTADKAVRLVTERPEQEKFRKILMAAYGSECCISRCPIPQSLDAAHIDPFIGSKSNHVQNGLLLRRDLHSLFDKNLLAVDPVTRLVHFDPEVLDYEEYAGWNQRVIIRPPVMQPHNLASSDALKRRWKAFVSCARELQER